MSPGQPYAVLPLQMQALPRAGQDGRRVGPAWPAVWTLPEVHPVRQEIPRHSLGRGGSGEYQQRGGVCVGTVPLYVSPYASHSPPDCLYSNAHIVLS